MRLFYDFHIHSCLSPCGSEDMTPANIVNMAALKGLDAVSVCDHNAGANLRAAAAAAREAGILFVPGIELNTAEEVHLLGYFENIEDACALGDEMYRALPCLPNNEDFFGRQVIMDENDREAGRADKLLISALPFSIDQCVRMIREHGGVAVPAHINKGANSILSNLGFLPPELHFTALEIFRYLPAGVPDLSGYRILHSSDAHTLEDISEREDFLDVSEKSVRAIITFLSKQV